MALFNDQFLAVGCNTGDITVWDVQCQRPDLATSNPHHAPYTDRDLEEECRCAKTSDTGIAYRSPASNAVVWTHGHTPHTEINSVAWANGPHGPTLSSVGDDANIRTWFPDRTLRDHIAHLATQD
jgi:WD40 repeat protein